LSQFPLKISKQNILAGLPWIIHQKTKYTRMYNHFSRKFNMWKKCNCCRQSSNDQIENISNVS